MDDDAAIAKMFEQAILERLSASDKPVYWNDEGMALLQQASDEAWAAMDPADRQKLIDASYRFVIECLRA
jgi:hypothetical protein